MEIFVSNDRKGITAKVPLLLYRCVSWIALKETLYIYIDDQPFPPPNKSTVHDAIFRYQRVRKE